MNKTYQELCDENLQLREQLETAEASAKCARLASRQALAKAETLEQFQDAARHELPVPREVRRTSDMSVELSFHSCRLASEFERLMTPVKAPVWVGVDMAGGAR